MPDSETVLTATDWDAAPELRDKVREVALRYGRDNRVLPQVEQALTRLGLNAGRTYAVTLTASVTLPPDAPRPSTGERDAVAAQLRAGLPGYVQRIVGGYVDPANSVRVTDAVADVTEVRA